MIRRLLPACNKALGTLVYQIQTGLCPKWGMDRSFIAAEVYNALAEHEGWRSYCDPSLAFDRAELDDLLELWRTARGRNIMPARTSLTARLLKRHMPCIAIYERIDTSPVRYRVRLMGTRFAEIFGDLTGRIVDEAIPASGVKRFHSAPETVLAAGAPLRFLSNTDLVGKQFYAAEYLMVPLTGDDGYPDMVLSRAHFSAVMSWPTYLNAAKRRTASQTA